MHHYTTQTSTSLWTKPGMQQVWQQPFVAEALQHKFLLHGLLALAASHRLHLTLSDLPSSYQHQAIKHRALALKHTVPVFNHISPSNSTALFAPSSVIALLSLTVPPSDAPSSPSNMTAPLDALLEFFTLMRGVPTVLDSAKVPIMQSHFAPLLDRQWHPHTYPLAPELAQQFEDVATVIRTRSPDTAAKEACTTALERLVRTYKTFPVVKDDEGMAFVWSAGCPALFFELLRRREPAALVVLAYYLVMLSSIEQVWWLEGKARAVMEAITGCLPLSWQRYMVWPWDVVSRSRRVCVVDDVVTVA